MTHNTNGILISFEGSEGCGKTTQIDVLQQKMAELERDVIVTREPGGTQLGEAMRHLLKHAPEGSEMFPETELLLFAASRAQLVREVIEPGLEAGKIILCDRFLDSTTVYQGVARNLSADPVQMINQFAVGNSLPDLTVVIDIPAEVGFERIQKRESDLPDRMEKENIDFYQQVREGYLILAQNFSERFIVIDGTQNVEIVSTQIWEELQTRFF